MVRRSGPSEGISPRDLALCGGLGAMGLLLPIVAHGLRFWPLFMPMHVPLMTLAFLVRPAAAATTAAVVPLLSSVLTGMPPLYPPVAAFMCIELGTMAGLAGSLYGSWPAARDKSWARAVILACVMALGRVLYIGTVYLFSLLVRLPAGLLAGLSLLAGWPGMILMIAVIPPMVGRIQGRMGRSG